jgi:predicted nucleic acid-binding protein
VKDWVLKEENDKLFLSVVSVGELRKGFAIMPDGKRRAQLEEWLEKYLLPLFASRIIPVTQAIAERWGVLEGMRHLKGRPLNAPDGMIAATALLQDLVIVTRNVKDFEDLGVTILNPWKTA